MPEFIKNHLIVINNLFRIGLCGAIAFLHQIAFITSAGLTHKFLTYKVMPLA